LLLVARTVDILLKLRKAMDCREIKRTYLALVCGHMQAETGTIDQPIGRSVHDRRKMVVTKGRGRSAQTTFHLLNRFRSYDLLEITLQTGRTHQIRVHFSHLGHPVFGDPEYGGRETWRRGMFAPERPLAGKLLNLIDRQMLHARRLEFTHPVSGKPIVCESDPPEDFKTVLAILEREGQ
ncbi:MAG TPA: RluA family pseudouridine synthase, partial [Candidatus Acidoferrum sp.]|nr:RluA family pseudouridine synthase [Candidatus Acidoferrum sp.]